MRRTIFSLATLALAGGFVTSLHAQGDDGHRGLVEVRSGDLRHGFFIAGALGDGMEQYQYSDAPGYTKSFDNPAAALRVGGAVSPSFRLGGEIFGWSGSVEDPAAFSGSDTETFGTLLLIGQFYPSYRAGLYVKGGIGVARSATDFGDGSSNGESGLGWSVGAGWEFPVSRGIALAPIVDFYQGAFTARGQNNAVLPTITERVLNIGASITFQSRWR